MKYPVGLNGKTVGAADMIKRGLYTEVVCQCGGLDSGFHRLKMVYPDRTVDLGVLIREGISYTTRKKIPTKALGNGEPVFCVISACDANQMKMIRLEAEKPVHELEGIREGRLQFESGSMYLLFQSKVSEGVK